MYGEHASFLTSRIFIKHGVNTLSTDCQGHNLPLETDSQTEYVGFFGKKRVVSKHLSFADLYLPSGEVIQICSRAEDDAELNRRALEAKTAAQAARKAIPPFVQKLSR